MSQLSKQRDNLQKVINTYHSLFDTTDLLTKELQSKHIGTSPHLVVHVHMYMFTWLLLIEQYAF